MIKKTQFQETINLIKSKLINSGYSLELKAGDIAKELKTKNHRNISRAMLNDELIPYKIIKIASDDANLSSTTTLIYYPSQHWITPVNSKDFDVESAFKELEEVDWVWNNANTKVGDLVFLYESKPKTLIKYCCLVTENNIEFINTIEDTKFWVDKTKFVEHKSKKFMRLRLLWILDEPIYLSDLFKNGMKAAPRGVQRLTKELSQFILNSNGDKTIHFDDNQQFVEGNYSKYLVNKYERSTKARKVCLDHFGYSCQACNIKLEDIYGSVAKDFIHVHHRIPLSEINKEYRVDPIKDLIPLCPNCHEIIHKFMSTGLNYYDSEKALFELFTVKE